MTSLVETLRPGRILVVDDQEPNVRFLERLLAHAGATEVRSTLDSRAVPSLVRDFEPDLILLDLSMPFVDGFTVLAQLQTMLPTGTYLPVLVVTADITPEAKRHALRAGARDFLTKPVDPIEVILRSNNLLETRALHQQLQLQNQRLEEKVQNRTRDLHDAHLETLERLAMASEYRDDATGEHIHRVGRHAALVAQALDLPPHDVSLIGLAAPLHDIGKIGIPDQILLKPGRLTAEEFEVMKAHTTIGARILAGGRSDLVRMARDIALCHHERWDGTGYPRGLLAEAIPIAGRIVAGCDVFDALTHTRPYKPAWSVEDALDEVGRQAGRQFDPAVAEAFLYVVRETVAPRVDRAQPA